MASFIATLARIAFGPQPEILCSRQIWQAGTKELRRRTNGRHESGAFLLGRKGKPHIIEEFIFYDDIDPHALDTGMVIIDGRRLGKLWSMCRETGREVIADVHVHPGSFGQSESDRANPVMAEVGHVAIILPYFAGGSNQPGKIGVHQYLGRRQWNDRSFEAFSLLHVGWWPWH